MTYESKKLDQSLPVKKVIEEKMILDLIELKDFIDKSGLKQKTIAEKSGISEVQLCLILQGKRKCEVGEYASICGALGVKVDKFIRKSSKTKNC